jgi:GDPmannose 4,6-dehydratase
MTRKALICGVSGQDGALLATSLLAKGYAVTGTSRDAVNGNFERLHQLGIHEAVTIVTMLPDDQASVTATLERVVPDEIYNLAAQTSVGVSFDKPDETHTSIATATLSLLESVRSLHLPARFFSAGSSECFGDTGEIPATENHRQRPLSPYGIAKAEAFQHVARYRADHGLFACTGILFNHDSPLRPAHFVTQKIARTVAEIATGQTNTLHLGSLGMSRDWGWAPEYVEAMQLMLQQQSPEDLVIATGETTTLEDYVAASFAAAGLDWHDHVAHNPVLVRETDIAISRADPSRAAERLGWRAEKRMNAVATAMVDAAIARLASQ